MRTVAAVGDSISNGWGMPTPGLSCWPWPARLAHALGAGFVNLSSNGARVEQMRHEQLPLLPDRADVATLMLGVNDVRPAGAMYPGFDDDAAGIVATVAARARTVVLATMPSAIRSRRRGYGESVLAANRTTRDLAAGYGNVILVDIEDAFDGHEDELGFDRIHLNALGHLRVARAAVEVLRGVGVDVAGDVPVASGGGVGPINRALGVAAAVRFALR